jgi:ABC-type Fe3+-citrate transport system substrate-binding protein
VRTIALLAAALLLLGASLGQAQVQVEHELGVTVVEGTPARVVTLEYSFADHLAQLGITPVGMAREARIPGYLEEFVGDVASVGTRAEPSLEAIVQQQPDLIVADLRRHAELYDELSAIAPTLVFNSLRGSYDDQLAAFESLAQALDRADDAEQALREHRASFAAAAAASGQEGSRVLVGVLSPGQFTAHSSTSFLGSFLERLGLPAALEPRAGETQFQLSLEGLATAEPEAIVLLCNPQDLTPLAEWSENPLWNALPAALGHRVYLFERDLWSKGRGLIAFDRILEVLNGSGLLQGNASRTAQTCHAI